MLKKIIRWRSFIIALFIGSLMWFIKNSRNKAQTVEIKEVVTVNPGVVEVN